MRKEELHLLDGQDEYYLDLSDILFCVASGNYCDIRMVQHTWIRAIRIQLGQLWTKIQEKGKMVEHHLEEVAVEDGQHHLDRVLLGIGGEVVDDAVAHHRVASPDGLLQLEDIVVFADAYLILDKLLCNSAASGE